MPKRWAEIVRELDVNVGSLNLDGGGTLPAVRQRVTIYGEPREDGANVVLIAHALTGSSRAAEWWPGLVGAGRPFDPQQCCIVGINALGSCYGSTGARSAAFPRVSVADIVRAQRRALERLGIARLALVAGGSLGGMQALQWALEAPQAVGAAVVIGAHDRFSTMGIALNALQREALALDERRGLRLARKIAMLTYKSDALLERRHGRHPDRHGAARFDVEGYLEHQADRFEARMNPFAYATLTHAMDAFDAGRAAPRGPVPPVLFAAISSDWLFPAKDVREASARWSMRGGRTEYTEIVSDHGHDAFLAEPQTVADAIAPFVREFAPATWHVPAAFTAHCAPPSACFPG